MPIRIVTITASFLDALHSRRTLHFALAVTVSVFGTRIVSGIDDSPDSQADRSIQAEISDHGFDESRLITLFDADRVHFLLREFCGQKGLTLQYEGCMAQSDNRPGIQRQLPTGATMWSVHGKLERRGVLFRLIAAHRVESNESWRLNIGKSELAIILVGPEIRNFDKDTRLTSQVKVGKFFEEFCSFAERQTKAHPFGIR